MELYTVRGVPELPLLHPGHNQFQPLLRCRTHFPFLHKQTRSSSGLRYRSNTSLRSTSEETSTETTLYVKDEPKSDNVVTAEDKGPLEKEETYDDSQLNGAPQEGSFLDNALKFLEDFDIKVDYEETYSILVFGGGGVVALWLLSAVVGAIDSIPVFPKVLELIGLGYTIWFSSRYLIFKKNRDELVARVEQIKQQILGSDDN